MTRAPSGLAAVVAAMGIVFGDIATSPLYTLPECLASPHGVAPLRDNVAGCVSLIIWSLILVVTIQYVVVESSQDPEAHGTTVRMRLPS